MSIKIGEQRSLRGWLGLYVLICILFFSGVFGLADDVDKDALIKQLRQQQVESEKQIKELEKTAIRKTLDWRAMLVRPKWNAAGVGKPSRWEGNVWDMAEWEENLNKWKKEGYNVMLWWGNNELTYGTHRLLRLAEFPEARELPPEQIERNIAQMKKLLRRSKELGMDNYLYSGYIATTRAFAKAHGHDANLPTSPTVHITHTNHKNMGVRNELTQRYVTSVIAEMAQTYEDLDGFYGSMGEAVPGRRSSYFAEAVVPGLKKSGRNPRYILMQWQTPIDEFLEDIIEKKAYDNLWTSFHGWNAEQISDAKPYPHLVEWGQRVGLPMVVTIYPANVSAFPFNSPKFAYEIVQEMKKVPNLCGFEYWEFSGRKLSPLFRKALARYSMSDEPYCEEPWLKILEDKFGDREAAKHFLNAYDISGKIIPEFCALVFTGHDRFRRELRVPYRFFTDKGYPFTWLTSRVRGEPLQPVWNYARWVARNPKQFKDNNGTSVTRNKKGAYDNYRQITVWRTEGGMVYDIIPPVHMAKIRQMGERCLQEAESGLKTVKKNHKEAKRLRNWMKSYQLLARYYQAKVAAAIASLVYADEHGSRDRQMRLGGLPGKPPISADSYRPEDRLEAERLADEAVSCHAEFAQFTHEYITPVMMKLYGEPVRCLVGGKDIMALHEQEKDERKQLAKLFGWPQSQKPSKPAINFKRPEKVDPLYPAE